MPFEMVHHFKGAVLGVVLDVGPVDLLSLVLAARHDVQLLLASGDAQRPDLGIVLHRTKQLTFLLCLVLDRMMGLVLSNRSHGLAVEDADFPV